MANLLFEETMEGATPFPGIQKQACCAYSVTYPTDIKFSGSKSARFELRATDPTVSSGTRCEFNFDSNTHKERWYSYNIYFPATSGEYDIDPTSEEIFTQFHQSGGASPSISFQSLNDRIRIDIRPDTSTKVRVDLGAINKGTWETFVYHIIHSHGDDGLIQVWRNGNKVLDRTGPCAYDLALGFTMPKLKLGIYKWDWNGDTVADSVTTKRVLYFDNVRVGNENATYNDMVGTASVYPTANAGGDKYITLPTTTTTLTGSGNDPEGGSVTYAWTQVSGPSTASITSATSASTGITALSSAGTYVFKLTVTKAGGLTAEDTVNVVVSSAANVAPVANAGVDQTITLPTSQVTLSGSSSSDSDGTITNYQWTRISGPNTPSITSSTSVNTTVTGLIEGTYVFQLTVTDNGGLTASDIMQVTVNPAVPPPNNPPTVDAGTNQSITINDTLTLTGNADDSDGNIAQYAWTQISGPNTATITTPTSSSTTVTGIIAGTYIFRLTVTDDDAATAFDSVQIVVSNPVNELPNANAGADQTITLPTNSVTVDGSNSSDPDGTITDYFWTKTVGGAANITTPDSAITTITGLEEGNYEFRLTVTDNDGGVDTNHMQVTVLPGNTPPNVSAGSDKTVTLPTNSTTLTAIATDGDGTIATYAWTKVSGPSGGAITSPSSDSTTITGLVAGTYVYRITVTDDDGATKSDDVSVFVATSVPTVNSFYLINTASDVVTNIQVINGMTISKASLGFKGVSILANVSGSPDKVKFELSGPKKVAKSDDTAPYCLFGDDGAGNYYHGAWNPPASGVYTLKVTPVKGGINYPATTISFTITS